MRSFYELLEANFKLKFQQPLRMHFRWWNIAVSRFWNEVIEIDLKTIFQCKQCGVRPPMLVADGTTIGLKAEKLQGLQNLFVPSGSRAVSRAPKYAERMFVKKYKNRQILCRAAKERNWPDMRSIVEGDAGMEIVRNFLSEIDTNKKPTAGMLKLFKELSKNTSSTSLFQVKNLRLMRDLQAYCLGDESLNFIRGLSNISLQIELREYYPVLTNIITKLATENGMLSKEIGCFISHVIEHAISFFESMPKQSTEKFVPYTGPEVVTELYPNFPLRFQRPYYALSTAKQDKIAWKNMCHKTWKKPDALTPGIFLVVCPCKKKSVYGFSLMVKSESPSFIFDIVTTRFESDYRPDWAYDASCKAKGSHCLY